MAALPKAFQEYLVSIPLIQIEPQIVVTKEMRSSDTFRQISASVKEIGLIEPLAVFPRPGKSYLLLDGHLRYEVLKHNGRKEAKCLLATDDEAYTYNRRVNTIPPIAQHLMLLEALRNGVTEERIAKSLNVDVSVIRQKRNMLNGVCSEAVELLRNYKLSAKVFSVLRKMKPLRQVEVAEHMIANSSFSYTFVAALLYGTKADALIEDRVKHRVSKPANDGGAERLAKESDDLLLNLKGLEDSFGKDALALTVCQGYVERLLKNAKVRRYLERRHGDSLGALQLWLEKRQLIS
ncbi:plasmid partitioning protein RepB C-terminal domain-containing protein [Granulicella cerasi]|uniref:Plasmid partitioning protein RepB C-terminal domain-containing protein n=1 Tax=Granulicella cerasi TaxID=741063 RepID=A0ABW1ZCY0_9BACT|nr:plasmid partitioning protein RepB C-terminal domain-containing protein [Granulicella cerasi]